MKKFTCFLSCLVIMGCASGAFAWCEWNNGGGDHNWGNVANWQGPGTDGLPNAGLDAILRDPGAGNYAQVSSGSAAAGQLWVGYYGSTAVLNVNGGSLSVSQCRIAVDSGSGTVNVSSGSLTSSSDSTVGNSGAATGYLNISGTGSYTNTGYEFIGNAGAVGHVNVSGGTANFNALRGESGSMTISGGAVTVGTDTTVGEGSAYNLTMTGGTFNQTGGWMYIGWAGGSGIVNLDGGTMSVNNLDFANGTLDLKGSGTLIIQNDWADASFEASYDAGLGLITVNGGQNAVGMLNITEQAGTGYAVVTVTPEPMTMLLLGLGGLFIRRK